MKIVIIGATGTIGSEVARLLSAGHEIVTAGSKSGELRLDLASPASLAGFYDRLGPFDALVSAAGQARFGPLEQLSDDDFAFSLANKLMGQVNLVRLGLRHIRDNGSFTLTSGVLSRQPIPGSAAISLVNAALEGFVRAAALEMPRGIRINAVSPVWVSETLQAMGRDPGGGLPAHLVARSYRQAVEGGCSGRILDVLDFA